MKHTITIDSTEPFSHNVAEIAGLIRAFAVDQIHQVQKDQSDVNDTEQMVRLIMEGVSERLDD